MSTNISVSAPTISPENQPFWSAANEKQLLIKKCEHCDQCHWYPRLICPFCGSDKTVWHPSAGLGSVYSYSVVRGEPPKVAAYIALGEGIVMASILSTDDPTKIQFGDRVQVSFQSVEPEGNQWVPIFERING